jgi:hypothetical protein
MIVRPLFVAASILIAALVAAVIPTMIPTVIAVVAKGKAEEGARDRWLDPATSVDDLRAMLKPYDPDLMKAYEVSRVVNSVKNDTPECVEPKS